MKAFKKFYVLISDCVSTEEVMFCTKYWDFTNNIEEAARFDSQKSAHLFLAYPPKNCPLYNDLRIKQASIEYNW